MGVLSLRAFNRAAYKAVETEKAWQQLYKSLRTLRVGDFTHAHFACKRMHISNEAKDGHLEAFVFSRGLKPKGLFALKCAALKITGSFGML